MAGLTLFGDGAVTTEGQAPWCPVPERSEPTPLFAYRQPVYAGGPNQAPLTYREVQRTEYRIPGAGTYEVSLREDATFLANADGVPRGTTQGLIEGPTGVARLAIVSGGAVQTRFHDGRSTVAVTGEYVTVAYQLPERAVLLDTQALAPPAGPEDSLSVVIGRGVVRVVGVPARSRVPSEWRTADFFRQGFDPEFTVLVPLRLHPGATDIRVAGFYEAQGASFGIFQVPYVLQLWAGDPLLGGVPVASLTGEGLGYGHAADLSWVPAGAATHVVVVPGPGQVDGITGIFYQRGYF